MQTLPSQVEGGVLHWSAPEISFSGSTLLVFHRVREMGKLESSTKLESSLKNKSILEFLILNPPPPVFTTKSQKKKSPFKNVPFCIYISPFGLSVKIFCCFIHSLRSKILKIWHGKIVFSALQNVQKKNLLIVSWLVNLPPLPSPPPEIRAW